MSAGCARQQYTQVSDIPASAYEVGLAPVGDGFVAVWYDTRDGHGEIYLRRLDGDGHPIAPERRLTVGTADAYEADITPAHLHQGSGGPADTVIIGWYEKTADGRLTPKIGAWALDGTARWTRALSPKGRNTVVRSDGALVFAAWIEDEVDDRAGVWGAWWRADGVPLISARRLADAGKTTWNLNAAIDPQSTLGRPHAWIAFDAKTTAVRADEIFIADMTEMSSSVRQITPDDGHASKYPDLSFSGPSTGPGGGDRAALTWFDEKDGNQEVYLMVGPREAVTPGTTPSVSGVTPTRITNTPGHSIGAYLAWNGDRLGLAWCDDTPGNEELYFQSFDAAGHPAGAITRVTTTDAQSSIPAIKPWRNGFALLWNEYVPASPDGHGGGESQVAFKFLP